MADVSVVIPVFNRVEDVKRAVNSVLAGCTLPVELIVVDDGSDPEVRVDIEPWVQAKGGLYTRQARSGVSAARNAGISRASGEWIALLDSDDLWQSDKLTKQLRFHEENTDILVSQTGEIWIRNGMRVNQKNIHTQPVGEIFSQCLARCCVGPSSVVLHRSVFDEVGLFATELPACEDFEFWLRVSSRFQVGLLPERLIVKNGGAGDQLSRLFPAMDRFRAYSIMKVLSEGRLNTQQQQQARAALFEKLAIIEAGGSKRGSTLGILAGSIRESLMTKESSLKMEKFLF